MDTQEKKMEKFKELCFHYLIRQGIVALRSYGRFLNLPRPTCYAKTELVQKIISVLSGEQKVQRTNRGAPIKNNYSCAEIVSKIENLREQTLDGQPPSTKQEKKVLHFTIAIEKLDFQQKQLLKQFIDSL